MDASRRILRSTSARLFAGAFAFAAMGTLGAQEPLRVLQHLPQSPARPSDVITVTFDRPVNGTLEKSVDPARFVRVEPDVQARIEWRDPSTIRIIPGVPLEPAHRYVVTVDTGFAAFDGSRLRAPERFALDVRGPAMLISTPRLDAINGSQMDPTGKLMMLFSGPISDSLLERVVRLDVRAGDACAAARSIGYRVVRHLPRPGDRDQFQNRYRVNDSAFDLRFSHFVVLEPAEEPPWGCAATLVVPSLDSLDTPTLRYPMRTAPYFELTKVTCASANDCAGSQSVTIQFSVEVPTSALMSAVHLEPTGVFVPVPPTGVAAASLHVRANFAPRSTYRITVDPTLRDWYGRLLTGRRERIIVTGDLLADFGVQGGLVTLVPIDRPMLRVRHLNVDSVKILLKPVPDSQRAREIVSPSSPRDDGGWQPSRRDDHAWQARDTVVRTVALPAPVNVERTTEIALPELTSRFRGRLVMVQLSPRPRAASAPSSAPDTAQITRYAGSVLDSAHLRSLIQATDLMAHAKLNARGGAVWVTSARTGRPVPGAAVRILDNQGTALATATTDARGIVAMTIPAAARRTMPATDFDESYYERYGYWNEGYDRYVQFVVEIRLGEDRSLTAVRLSAAMPGASALGAEIEGVSLASGAERHAVVFSERGVYRPGDEVHLGAIVREGNLGSLRAPPRGDSVRVRVAHYSSIDWHRVMDRDTVVPLSRFGTFADAFHLASNAALADYYATVSLFRGGSWQLAGGAQFRVVEYRAPEFLVKLSIDSAVHFRGDTLRAAVAARFLFDAPMHGASMQWNATFVELSPWDVKIPGLGREFVVGNQRGWWEAQEWAPPVQGSSGVDTLDANGLVTSRIATDSVRTSRGARVEISVAVTDLNRQVVDAEATTLVHGSSFYLALRDSGGSYWWWPTGKPRSIGLIAVRPDGRRVPGVRVRLATVELHWAPPLNSNDATGGYAWRWRADTVRVDTLVTSDSLVTLHITPAHEGPLALIATAVDEVGRPVRTTMSPYVYGGAALAGASKVRLPVALAKDRLRAGDEAVASFTVPFDSADAWVTLEREGLRQQRFLRQVHGPVTVRFPMTEADAPNVFVSVTTVRLGDATGTDSLFERLRVGYAALRVDDAPKRLAVRVRALRARYAPGDSATIEMRVHDGRGRNAQSAVTVWAADEGVLALTAYQTPDPMRRLYAFTADGLTMVTSLSSFQERDPQLRWREWQRWGLVLRGAEASSPAPRARGEVSVRTRGDLLERSDFRATAFYRSGVVTDSLGVARVTVKLPDNVTTFRLMAVAAGEGDRYGSAEAPLVVTKPLLVRAALPRFVRAGDTLDAGGVVNVREARAGTIDAAAAGRGVELIGPAKRRASLDPKGTDLRFRWRALDTDSAHFRLSATDGVNADAVAVALPVRAAQVPQAHTISGLVRDSSIVRFRLPRDLDPDQSRLTIRVGSSPLPALRLARHYATIYPYDCTEQLTSTGRILVTLYDLERAGIPVLGDSSNVREQLQRIADELLRRQNAEGGIGYWGRDGWTSPWVSAYAGLFLQDARRFGVGFDSAALPKLAAYLEHWLKTAPLFPDTTFGARDVRARAVALHLEHRLAATVFLGRAPVAVDSALRGRARVALDSALRPLVGASHRLAWEDRVWLAELLEQTGDTTGARTLLNALWRTLGTAGNRVEFPDSVLWTPGFPSRVRPAARLLTATLAIAPDHPRLGALVERLSTRTRAEWNWWCNTQDYASAAVAIAAFARTQRAGDASVAVRIGSAAGRGRAVDIASVRGVARDTSFALTGLTEVSGDSVEVDVRLHARNGASYFALTVDAMTRERPTRPDLRGISVERWYERFDDGRTVTDVREGDLVNVRMRVTVTGDREFVAVEDALPAGLEAVDLTLRTSGTLAPFVTVASDSATRRRDTDAGGTPVSELYGSWYGGWWSPWEHKEMHDDRVWYFARMLSRGSYTLRYVARATTAGRFVRPQAHAEEMYNPSLSGRSDGGWFVVRQAAASRER